MPPGPVVQQQVRGNAVVHAPTDGDKQGQGLDLQAPGIFVLGSSRQGRILLYMHQPMEIGKDRVLTCRQQTCSRELQSKVSEAGGWGYCL